MSAVVAIFVVGFASRVSKASDWWQPQASENLRWQIQLQGDIKLIPGVDVYAVDIDVSQASIEAAKTDGARLMCYISAGSVENWRSDYQQFPQQVVGKTYTDWPGERWLDIRQIKKLAPIMRARMDKCQARGFDVIDADNINGFENDTGFPLTQKDAISYVRWLAAESHRRGMAFSLKNGEGLLAQVADVVDMMQSESCVFYDNCDAVKALTKKNKPVFAVEYQGQLDVTKFRQSACVIAREYRFSMIYRDRSLHKDGVYESCN